MKKNLLYISLLLLIPIFVVSLIYKCSKEKEFLLKEPTTKTQTIKINKNDNIIELNLEDYIIGVVAGEMPASFHIEALKAQAVASRTYAMYKIEQNKSIKTTTDDQVYITEKEMQEKWGSDYNYYYNKIKNAVNLTKREVMKKENKIFKAFYFAISNGKTADSITVFGESNLKSVSSPWDNETIKNFSVTKEFTKQELEKKLNIKNITSIEITDYDETNRVEKIRINDKYYSGIEFRKLLLLRSTDFKIEIENNIYKITTKGYGHGVGMSQYGANGMAKENYNYKEILEHYYQEIKIEKI